jgi:hypothetical protein
VQGERLVSDYGCRNCHIIDGEGGRIRDRYTDETLTLAPPVIQGQGFKTQPTWLFHFLKDPGKVQIRPWLKIRMPTFGFTDIEATAIAKYFSAKDGKPWPYMHIDPKPPAPERLTQARAMFIDLKCLSCHTTGAPPPGVSVADLAPDLNLAKDRLRPDWIPVWLADPGKLMEGTRMPAFWPDGQSPLPQYFNGDSKEQWNALRDLLMNLSPQVASKPPAANQKAAPKKKASAPTMGKKSKTAMLLE